MNSSCLPAQQAAQLDQALFETFSLEQLMEIAGYSAAQAFVHFAKKNIPNERRVVVACGPGNNGGDGLIAARYLKLAGFSPIVVCPKSKFTQLLQQLALCAVPVLQEFTQELEQIPLVFDCIFGFSFSGHVREPYATMISRFAGRRVVSLDVPSGWPVDQSEDFAEKGFVPAAIISSSVPKPCGCLAQKLGAAHYLNCNIVPDAVKRQYGIEWVAGLWRDVSESFVLLSE